MDVSGGFGFTVTQHHPSMGEYQAKDNQACELLVGQGTLRKLHRRDGKAIAREGEMSA